MPQDNINPTTIKKYRLAAEQFDIAEDAVFGALCNFCREKPVTDRFAASPETILSFAEDVIDLCEAEELFSFAEGQHDLTILFGNLRRRDPEGWEALRKKYKLPASVCTVDLDAEITLSVYAPPQN